MVFNENPSNAINWLMTEAGDVTLWELFLVGLRPEDSHQRLNVNWEANVASLVEVKYNPKTMKEDRKLPAQLATLLLGDRGIYALRRMYAVVSYVLLLRKYNPHWNTVVWELYDALQEGGLVSDLKTHTASEYYCLLKQFHSEGDLSRMTMLEDANHCFKYRAPIEFKGRWWNIYTLLLLYYLPTEATEEMVDILHKVSPSAKSSTNFILGRTEMEVEFNLDGEVVTLNKGRISRSRYTLRAEGASGLVYFPSACHFLAWTALHWVVQNLDRQDMSHLINRDATSLVAPNRVYGDPSPLNLTLDQNNVGHLQYASSERYGHAFLASIWEDKEIYTIPDALAPVYGEGLPAIIQHQAMNLRVGNAAAAMGKSTIWMVLDEKLVQISTSDFQVDKTTKTFNRDSLRTRCQPIVGVQRESSTGLSGFESLLNAFRS